MKTKLEIIEETAAFYNSENRAYDEQDATCYYQTADGKQCAVGRCMMEPSKYAWNTSQGGAGAESLLETNGDDILKPEYRGHDTGFWQDVQRLHDYIDNWDKNGLTEDGKKHKESLIRKYS